MSEDWRVGARAHCKDGWNVSIQAGATMYCWPRQNAAEVDVYKEVELGFVSAPEPRLAEWEEVMVDEDGNPKGDPCERVFSYVPVEVVREVFEKHGGFSHLEGGARLPQGVLQSPVECSLNVVRMVRLGRDLGPTSPGPEGNDSFGVQVRVTGLVIEDGSVKLLAAKEVDPLTVRVQVLDAAGELQTPSNVRVFPEVEGFGFALTDEERGEAQAKLARAVIPEFAGVN